jgi:WD40 repeat protein
MIKNKNAEEESKKPPPPDPSVFRGQSGTDCQCSSVVECGENDRFLLLTADGDGRVKLWNGETKRNVWTVGDDDDDDDDDDENTTRDPKRKVSSSILAIEIVEDCKESDRCTFLTHERDGTVCLWVSSPEENEEKEEDIFPPKRWRRKPMLKQVLETESECHTFCPMSNVITTVSSLEEEKKRGVVVARPASERGAVELVSVDLEGGRMTSKPILLEKREKVTTGEGSEEGEEEEEEDNEKYGSVSALKFLSRRTLLIGYESGHVTVVRTDEGDFLDAGSSNSNVHLPNNTERCFKDMVTCIDSYVQRKNDEEDENIDCKDRMHVVAIGCADGSVTLYMGIELFRSVIANFSLLSVSEGVYEEIFALKKDSTKGPYHSPDESTQGVASLSFRADRKLLAVGYWDGKTRIFSHRKCWDSGPAHRIGPILACLKTEKLVRTDRLPGVASVQFRKKGGKELLVCTRQDGCCRVWPIFPPSGG